MQRIEEVLKSMTFEFFGSGKHKVSVKDHLAEENALLLDVRSKEEYETLAIKLGYHIPVLHIPTDEVVNRLAEIPKDKHIGIFCSSGVRATMIYLYLRANEYENVRILDGGYKSLVEELKPGKILKTIKQKTN